MCGVCGCGSKGMEHEHVIEHGHHDHDRHRHHHAHGDEHAHVHDHDHHHPPSHASSRVAPSADPHPHAHAREHGTPRDDEHGRRTVRVERDILERNDRFAAINRRLFAATKTLALNLVSGPGAGKTSLLVRTLTDLGGRIPLAVIEGDQQTSLDAERIAATGVRALQINTGKMCHLDASMVESALGKLPPPEGGVLFIENVGNLVCPAGFDLGEDGKVVLVSVTEGEDKPLKYPDMFHAARLVIVTKTDLLPHLDLDLAALEENIRRVNPRADVLRVSVKSGEGLEGWLAWIEGRMRARQSPHV